MSLSIIAFLVLVAAFAIGSFTKINAGLLATVAAFGVADDLRLIRSVKRAAACVL